MNIDEQEWCNELDPPHLVLSLRVPLSEITPFSQPPNGG